MVVQPRVASFFPEGEEEITNQLFGFDLVTKRGDRIDHKTGHADGVDDVNDGLDEGMDVVQFKRGFVEPKPRIQHVHVKDVDQAGVNHVHVKERILADVFQQFDGGFGGGKVGAGLAGEGPSHEKFHAQRGLSRTAGSGCQHR